MLAGLPKVEKKQVSYLSLLNADMVYSPNKVPTTILNAILSEDTAYHNRQMWTMFQSLYYTIL